MCSISSSEVPTPFKGGIRATELESSGAPVEWSIEWVLPLPRPGPMEDAQWDLSIIWSLRKNIWLSVRNIWSSQRGNNSINGSLSEISYVKFFRRLFPFIQNLCWNPIRSSRSFVVEFLLYLKFIVCSKQLTRYSSQRIWATMSCTGHYISQSMCQTSITSFQTLNWSITVKEGDNNIS